MGFDRSRRASGEREVGGAGEAGEAGGAGGVSPGRVTAVTGDCDTFNSPLESVALMQNAIARYRSEIFCVVRAFPQRVENDEMANLRHQSSQRLQISLCIVPAAELSDGQSLQGRQLTHDVPRLKFIPVGQLSGYMCWYHRCILPTLWVVKEMRSPLIFQVGGRLLALKEVSSRTGIPYTTIATYAKSTGMATVDYTALHKIARVFDISIEDVVEIVEE